MLFAPLRGRSSMVERELPKLYTRVRFPSPAPISSIFNKLDYSVSYVALLDRYNLNYPLYYARTCRVIGLWYRGAYLHTGSRSIVHAATVQHEHKALTEVDLGYWLFIEKLFYRIDDVLNATGIALADGEFDPAGLWVIFGVPLLAAFAIYYLIKKIF